MEAGRDYVSESAHEMVQDGQCDDTIREMIAEGQFDDAVKERIKTLFDGWTPGLRHRFYDYLLEGLEQLES